jgi:hypothetical protein
MSSTDARSRLSATRIGRSRAAGSPTREHRPDLVESDRGGHQRSRIDGSGRERLDRAGQTR